MEYLLTSAETYRVPTVEDTEILHDQLKQSPNFALVSFGYKTKQIKEKGEVIDEYQLVTVKKLFNDEKEPNTFVKLQYEVN